MLKIISRPLAILAAFAFLGAAAHAETIETQARQAIVLDYNTGAVLLEKNADDLMTPSSMSKLMTVYLVFERLKSGNLQMTDMLPVSETAWRRNYKSGGSLMFLPVNSQVRVEDLLRGVIIQSGNDACSVLAEGLSGSEDAFAEDMTRKARQLGLERSSFKNASGWPEPGHQMTARDLATLSAHLIRDFPEYYPLFAEPNFTFNGIKQDNRNPLIWKNVPGADGLKTGHTQEGGFGDVGSVIRNGRRVIVVINGLPSIKARAEESERLIEWAFREFSAYKLAKAGETVVDADVWLGRSATVPLTVASDFEVTLRRSARRDMKVAATYDSPIKAPVKAGSPVGMLVMTAPGSAPVQVPLVAAADVEKLGFMGRIGSALGYILWGGGKS